MGAAREHRLATFHRASRPLIPAQEGGGDRDGYLANVLLPSSAAVPSTSAKVDQGGNQRVSTRESFQTCHCRIEQLNIPHIATLFLVLLLKVVGGKTFQEVVSLQLQLKLNRSET